MAFPFSAVLWNIDKTIHTVIVKEYWSKNKKKKVAELKNGTCVRVDGTDDHEHCESYKITFDATHNLDLDTGVTNGPNGYAEGWVKCANVDDKKEGHPDCSMGHRCNGHRASKLYRELLPGALFCGECKQEVMAARRIVMTAEERWQLSQPKEQKEEIPEPARGTFLELNRAKKERHAERHEEIPDPPNRRKSASSSSNPPKCPPVVIVKQGQTEEFPEAEKELKEEEKEKVTQRWMETGWKDQQKVEKIPARGKIVLKKPESASSSHKSSDVKKEQKEENPEQKRERGQKRKIDVQTTKEPTDVN